MSIFEQVSIIGDGAMGTVLATLLCEKNVCVRMWGYDAEQLKEIAAAGENVKFLPGYKLPEDLVFEPEDARIMNGADLIVSAVPCQFMRGVWGRLKKNVPKNILNGNVPIVSVAKGIENDTLLRPTQIIADILGDGVRCVKKAPGRSLRRLPRRRTGQKGSVHLQRSLAASLYQH